MAGLEFEVKKQQKFSDRMYEIVKEIAPEDSDLFIEKRKPSAFFGTPLMSHLSMMKADSLIIV